MCVGGVCGQVVLGGLCTLTHCILCRVAFFAGAAAAAWCGAVFYLAYESGHNRKSLYLQ